MTNYTNNLNRPDTYYRTGHFEVDHSTFGGKIYESDFYTNHGRKTKVSTGSVVASRILSDSKFDKICKKNEELRKVGNKGIIKYKKLDNQVK